MTRLPGLVGLTFHGADGGDTRKKNNKTSKTVMLDEGLCCEENLNGKNAREQEGRGQTSLRGMLSVSRGGQGASQEDVGKRLLPSWMYPLNDGNRYIV